MWGLSIQFLQALVSWANVVAFVCAVLTGAALFLSAYVSSNIADIVQGDADRRITEARTRGDEARAQAAEANERASAAAERAATLEKEAAEANRIAEEERFARIKIEQRIANRLLTQEQHKAIVEEMHNFKNVHIAIGEAPMTTESMLFANSLIAAFAEAGWTTEHRTGYAANLEQRLFSFGIQICIAPNNTAVSIGNILAQTLNSIGFAPVTSGPDLIKPETESKLLLIIGPRP
jgi:hypothetical protein